MTDITVVGNISEPELRFTPDGKSVLNFSLAENHRKKQGNDGSMTAPPGGRFPCGRTRLKPSLTPYRRVTV